MNDEQELLLRQPASEATAISTETCSSYGCSDTTGNEMTHTCTQLCKTGLPLILPHAGMYSEPQRHFTTPLHSTHTGLQPSAMPAPRASAAGGRTAAAAAASSTTTGHSSAAAAGRNRTTSAGQHSTDIIPVSAPSSGTHAGETALTTTVPRPVAITAKGLRQFVTTASGVRVFLQYVLMLVLHGVP